MGTTVDASGIIVGKINEAVNDRSNVNYLLNLPSLKAFTVMTLLKSLEFSMYIAEKKKKSMKNNLKFSEIASFLINQAKFSKKIHFILID